MAERYRCVQAFFVSSAFALAVFGCPVTYDLGSALHGDATDAGQDAAAIPTDGGAFGASGDSGQNDGSSPNRNASTEVSARSSLVALGQNFSCAITNAGAVKCWGSIRFAGTHEEGTATATAPLGAALSAGVTSLAARYRHVCALAAGGAVWCWGKSGSGAAGTTKDSDVPSLVTGLGQGVVEIAAGRYHSCARLASGAVKCWGDNNLHQLGTEAQIGSSTRFPQTTAIIEGARAIAAGVDFTCALVASGVVCWGGNSSGVLRSATVPDTGTPTPVAIAGTSDAVDIRAADTFVCARNGQGAIKCWGEQVGPFTADAWTALDLASLTPGGWRHMCGITTAGALVCWGNNMFGALGDGTTNGTGPAGPAGLRVIAAAAGQSHTCARTVSGAVCFGTSSYSDLGSENPAYPGHTIVEGF